MWHAPRHLSALVLQRVCDVRILWTTSLRTDPIHNLVTTITRGYHSEENEEEGERKRSYAPMYGYAKKLELKRRMKESASSEEELKRHIHKRTLSAEESLLAMDLLRKHKATRRDAKHLRKMKRETPQRVKQITDFRSLPFAYCEPTTNKVVRSIVSQLEKQDPHESHDEEQEIKKDQLMRIPEDENESVGSLEGLQFRHGTPRPPRPPRHAPAFDLPLSRPNTKAFHKVRPQTMDILDMQFAEWFIGMTEAQLPFKVSPKGRPYFALEHTDMQLFSKIRSRLHFGHVDDIKQLWYVMDDSNLRRIIHLLNGNLFLEKTRQTFSDWLEKYRSLGVWDDKEFEVKTTCGWQPQLNNKWLMGFVDSSFGMFAARLVESEIFPFFRINLKFWMVSDDRSLLEHLKQTFDGGQIEEDGELLRWTLKHRKHHLSLDRYCRMFRPFSLKNVTLTRYNRLVHYPFVKVKTQLAWTRLRTLVENLNTFERKSALTMRFHPYHHRYKQNTETQMHLARTGTSIADVKAYKVRQEKKDFPMWQSTPKLSLIEERD